MAGKKIELDFAPYLAEFIATFCFVFIGAGAVVAHSIVGPGAQIGEGASLIDLTVIGSAETVGAGIGLAGARVPGDS